MACILYREGTGTTEHGIECESTICEAGEVASLLASGWLANPPGYEPPEPVALEEEEPSAVEVGASGNVTAGEVDALNEEIDGLRKELELRIGIEANLNETVEQLKGELRQFRKTAETDEIDPVRAAGRDAGIEGWETMHLSSLKKALKELEA